MHVTLYLKHFPADGAPLIGGTSIAVDGLASGLSASGAEVAVLCEGQRRSSLKTKTGYRIEGFPARGRYHAFGIGPELKHYALEQMAPKQALCLVNGMFHPSAYAMARLLRNIGVPYVAAPHDPYNRAVFRRNPHLKWPYWYLFERRLLEQARAIQVLDIKHAECLRDVGIGTPVIETPNGVSPQCVPAEAELRWRCPGEPVQILFLGRIDAYNKGLDMLIDAFVHISGQAAARLTVQGPDWGDRARLARRAAAWGLSDNVEFRGPDYGRPAPQIIGEHDIFCLPSRFEGFGLAALEAMLAGRVLLVSEISGIARHVLASGCGVVVRPTRHGIETGLDALLKRRAEWREMGLSGRQYALVNLQWKKIAAEALEQYARLVA